MSPETLSSPATVGIGESLSVRESLTRIFPSPEGLVHHTFALLSAAIPLGIFVGIGLTGIREILTGQLTRKFSSHIPSLP